MTSLLWSTFTTIALLLLVPFLWRTLSRQGSRIVRHPYIKHSSLFSHDDRAFLKALRRATQDSYEIFGKIRVSDIIQPRKGVPAKILRPIFGPISGKVFDFVLCDRSTLSVICAVQLRDKTKPDKVDVDAAIAQLCESVSLPLITFPVVPDYSDEDILIKLTSAVAREPVYLMESDGRKEPHISNISDLEI